MKMIFLLYLALPQTRGSSFIYVNYLQPFFHNHEGQIDATVASFKARIYLFVQERIRMLWEHVASTVGQQQRAGLRGVRGVRRLSGGVLGQRQCAPARFGERPHLPLEDRAGNACHAQLERPTDAVVTENGDPSHRPESGGHAATRAALLALSASRKEDDQQERKAGDDASLQIHGASGEGGSWCPNGSRLRWGFMSLDATPRGLAHAFIAARGDALDG